MHGGRTPEPDTGPTAEVVVFRLGEVVYVVPRADVSAIRHSPRVRHVRGGRLAGADLPIVSLSDVLALGRDTSIDRRVLEVEHWGAPLGLEVTSIEGIRRVSVPELYPLPPLVERCCTSRALLGLAWLDGAWAVALDLAALLVEQGVEVPDRVEPGAEGGVP